MVIRNRIRMTIYNSNKAKQIILAKNSVIESLKIEISDLEVALVSQKKDLNEKHVKILKNYSETLKEKYAKQFDNFCKTFQSENSELKCQIKRLHYDLEASKQALLSSAMRKPVYSPGKYCDNG